MARQPVSPLRRQLARVRRRLVVQRLIDALVWAWGVALLGTTAWLVAQPFVVREPASWLNWTVAGSALAAATVVAVLSAALTAPPAVAAALALDERFGLRERVTTAVMLAPREAASPAGAALLADVNERLTPLRVADRFPLRLPRAAWLVPAGGLGLVLVVLFYRPAVPSARAGDEPLAADPETAARIAEALRPLQQRAARPPGEPPRSAELERLEAELDKLTRQPHQTKEQAREVVKEMSQLEDELARRQKELAERANALKAQLEQAERLRKKKDGPGNDLDRALSKGDFPKARDEAERLSRKLRQEEEADRLRKKKQDESLTPEERQRLNEEIERLERQALGRDDRERLQEQLKDLEDRLQRLSRSPEEQEEMLREMARNGELSDEELDRELDQLRKACKGCDAATRARLGRLAQKLKEARQALQQGKEDEAARQLDELARELGECDGEGEAAALAERLARLERARQALCRACDGRPVPAAGRRPESPDGPTQHKEERSRSELDRGRLQVIDRVPGGGFKGPRKPEELAEDIRRAAQEAPEAIDRQRLPKSAGNMARGYFEKLRGGDRGR